MNKVQAWSDENLVKACRYGNNEAFSILLKRYQDFAYAIALGCIKNTTDAQDVVQESFLKLIQALPSYKGQSKFSTWFYSLVYFTAIDWLRKHNKPETLKHSIIEEMSANATSLVSPVVELDKKVRSEYIHKALHQLREEEATILTLFYFMEQSLEEITTILEITTRNATKIKLFRARAALKKMLDRLLANDAKNKL